MLSKKYNYLFNKGFINTGFSKRIPDYAQDYKFKLLEKSINESGKNKFLDIGAGSGRLSILLSNTYFKSGYSLEVDTDKFLWNKILKENPNLELKDGFLQDLIPEFIKHNQKFDFILMSEVFEHIPLSDVDLFLESLSKTCSEKTKIFLTTPNRLVQGRAEESSRWYKIQPYGHHKHYTYDELNKIFSKYNFKIDWFAYESGNIKRKFYNKLFYPIARWDAKFINTKKLPKFVKLLYKYSSLPFTYLLRVFFWTFAQFIYFFEKNFNNSSNAETIVLQISRK